MHARTRRTAGLVAMMLVVLIGLPALGETVAAADQQEYIALGDSIAAGLVTSLPHDRGYPALVSNLLQKLDASQSPPTALKSVNLAVPGETDESFVSNGQLQQFKDEVAAVKARGASLQLVTLTLGGNDILNLQNQDNAARQAGLDKFKQSYPATVSDIEQALGDLKPTVVVTTYYDLTGSDPQVQNSDAWWVAQFNDVIRSTAQQHGFKIADLEAAFRDHIQDWTWYPTDVHPNNDGHAEIARLVWQASGLDQAPPNATVVKPGAGELTRSIPTVAVTANDNVGVSDVQLWVDGKQVSSLIYEPKLDEYLGLWDGRNATASQVTLSIHVTDLAGHVTTADVNVALPQSNGGG